MANGKWKPGRYIFKQFRLDSILKISMLYNVITAMSFKVSTHSARRFKTCGVNPSSDTPSNSHPCSFVPQLDVSMQVL